MGAHAAIRSAVPFLENGRFLSADILAAGKLVSSGILNTCISDGMLPGLKC